MQNNVSLCTIVKNSSDVINNFYDWAVDNFEEINIVVDSENDDETLPYVMSLGAINPRVHVLVNKFDNFSSQWDRSIEMSTKDFCIYMNCDEIIEELPPNGIEKYMNRTKAHVGVLNRFNLQRDQEHYNGIAFPDRQFRVIRMSTGIKMDGKVVDESLGIDRFTPVELLPWALIHWGHIRNPNALLLKGRDRKKFAEYDDADGRGLMAHGENWFLHRNIEWNRDEFLKDTPNNILNQSRKYWKI